MKEDKPEKKEKRITPGELADRFLTYWGIRKDGQEILVYFYGDFYRWEGGVYRRVSKDEMNVRATGHVQATGQIATSDLVNSVLLNLAPKMYLGEHTKLNRWIRGPKKDKADRSIVMENGIVSFNDRGDITLSEHTPDFFSVVKLPYAYDPDVECPRWNLFIEEISKKDKELMRLLQQWTGYLLTPSHEYQCFLLCLGDANAGKGTYVRAIRQMLGEENCSGIPIRSFVDRFSLSESYGKVLNVCGDAEEALNPKTENLIKEWTGEDRMLYERKYQTPFTAESTAKLIISANSFPTFTDKSNGSWRRMKIMPFERENMEYVDTKLRGKLEKELPGIFNWAVGGLVDLIKNDGFVVPEKSREMWEQYKGEANPAGLFLRERYYFDPQKQDIGVPAESTHTMYWVWCKDNGYMPLSDAKFGREVKRVFPGTNKQKRGPRGRQKAIYLGVLRRND